jgi:hypothetical protein
MKTLEKRKEDTLGYQTPRTPYKCYEFAYSALTNGQYVRKYKKALLEIYRKSIGNIKEQVSSKNRMIHSKKKTSNLCLNSSIEPVFS